MAALNVRVLLAHEPGLRRPRTAGALTGEPFDVSFVPHVLIAEGDKLILVSHDDAIEFSPSGGSGFGAHSPLGLRERMLAMRHPFPCLLRLLNVPLGGLSLH